MRPHKIRAILFDMDGVLIDAREWHYEALNMALAVFGLTISRHDHLVTFDGLSTSQKLQVMTSEQGLPQELHQTIGDLKQKFTRELIDTHCRPHIDQQFALSQLKAQGMRLAVCSNAIRSTVLTMLSRAELLPYIEFFMSNQDVRRPKPAPDIYMAAMERMGLEPTECLVVEDNHHGVTAARAAGAHVFQVASVHDVRLDTILSAIKHAEAGEAA